MVACLESMAANRVALDAVGDVSEMYRYGLRLSSRRIDTENYKCVRRLDDGQREKEREIKSKEVGKRGDLP